MCEGADGAIWFGTSNGVMKYDGLTWSSFTGKDGVVGAPITSLCCAEDGTIYAGSQQGLSCYKNGSWQRSFPYHQGQIHQVFQPVKPKQLAIIRAIITRWDQAQVWIYILFTR